MDHAEFSAGAGNASFRGHVGVWSKKAVRRKANHIRVMIRRGDLTGFQYGGKLLRISAAVVVAYETNNTVKARRED